MDVEQLIAEITARLDALEDIVEELRYAGPLGTRPLDDYDDDELEERFVAGDYW